MIILDENIDSDERELLRRWRIPVRQIGYDIGRKGLQDDAIVSLLCELRRPTFFTRAADFYKRTLGHARYSLVYLAIAPREVAVMVRRVLHHPEFNTEARRTGAVIRAASSGLTVWRLHAENEVVIAWPIG